MVATSRRWFWANGSKRSPRILLLDEPTRGIDVGAKAEIYRLIQDLKERGIAVVLASSELPELMALSDRILVLREGQPTALLKKIEFSPDLIMDYASPGGAVQDGVPGVAGSDAPEARPAA